MQVLMNVMVVLQILAALVMIGLVLIQHGKGADMGASFGSGASGSLFGATGSANFLSRSTAACAAVFFASTLGLAYFGNLRSAPVQGSSVLESGVTAPAPASAASAGPQIPGVGPAPATSAATPPVAAPVTVPSASAAPGVASAPVK